MNRNYIFAALPFAGISDAAVMVKAFSGYSDPTLTVVAIAGAVIAILLALKAFDMLRLPRFTWASSQPAQEVHNHYHTHYGHDDEDEDGCDGCDEDENYEYTAEDLQEARDEAHKEGYDEGYDVGHEEGYDAGYDAGYAERESEETLSEAEQLAKAIISALKLEAEVVLKPSTLAPVDTPAENTSKVSATEPAPTAQA